MDWHVPKGTAPPPRVLKVRNKRGLHARAAHKFVLAAERFDADITVTKDGSSVGGTSIMGLLMLAASMGSEITVSASGPDADAALDAIARLVEGKFGEE